MHQAIFVGDAQNVGSFFQGDRSGVSGGYCFFCLLVQHDTDLYRIVASLVMASASLALTSLVTPFHRDTEMIGIAAFLLSGGIL